MKSGIVKPRSITLSDEAIAKIDSAAQTLGRTRSSVLERVIMAMSDKSLIRYGRYAPTYAEDVNADNDIQPTAAAGGTAE